MSKGIRGTNKFAFTLAGLFLSTSITHAAVDSTASSSSYDKQRVIVKFNQTYDEGEIERWSRVSNTHKVWDNLRKKWNLDLEKKVFEQDGETSDNNSAIGKNTYLFETSPIIDVDKLVEDYQSAPGVVYAQADYQMQAYVEVNDPFYHSFGSLDILDINGQAYDDLWGIKKTKADQVWDETDGAGVVVAVIDSGLDLLHEDIGALWTNDGEIPGNGIDDDGNGYIDDVNGWDFVSNSAAMTDPHGHGSHVAGTIAAKGFNGTGVIGVAPAATVMPLRSLNSAGSGSNVDLAEAIVYAARNGADVVNNSWGCTNACPINPVIEEAVLLAQELGTVMVFAAGNSSDDVANYSPQNMAETITVAASGPSDMPAFGNGRFFSNFGDGIDVSAPGEIVLSLNSNGGSNSLRQTHVLQNNYIALNGTSMASPHVAGIVALLLQDYPDLSPEKVKNAVRMATQDIGETGFDPFFGAGLVDATKLDAAASVVDAMEITSPSGVQFVSTDQASIAVTGSAGGDQFNSYELSYKALSSEDDWTVIISGQTIPVEDGVLGDWDISSLESASYNLRLTINTVAGDSVDAYTSVALYVLDGEAAAVAIEGDDVIDVQTNGVDIVWSDFSLDFATFSLIPTGVHLHEAFTEETQLISQLEPPEVGIVDINEEYVVWSGINTLGFEEGPMTPQVHSFVRSLDTGAVIPVFPGEFAFALGLDGNSVIVSKLDFFTFAVELVRFDIDTGNVTKIADLFAPIERASVEDGLITWVDPYTEAAQYIDLTTGQGGIIAEGVDFDSTAKTDDGRIIWTVPGPDYMYDLWIRDTKRGTDKLIATNVTGYPSIDDDLVVFVQEDEAGKNVFYYHILSENTYHVSPVSNTDFEQSTGMTAVEDGLVVWGDYIPAVNKGALFYTQVDLDSLPKAPVIENISDIGHLVVNWSYDGESPFYYQIQWDDDPYFNSPEGTQSTIIPLNWGQIFDDFTHGEEVHVRVSACDINDECGPWSFSKSIVYTDLAQMAAPVLNPITEVSSGFFSRLQMSWDLPEELPFHYVVIEWSDDADFAETRGLTIRYESPTEVLKLLLGFYGTSHVRVAACNTGGCTPWSNTEAVEL